MPQLGSAIVSYKATGLRQMRKDMNDAEKGFKASSVAIVTGIAAIGASVVKIGMPFEQMMLNTASAMRGTEADLVALTAAARKAGAETEHTATQAGSSLLFMAKAGLDAGEAMRSLGTMLDFKTAIQNTLSLAKATDVLTDTTTAMGLSFKDMGHVADVFIASTNRSAMDTAQLGEAMSKVAGVARLYGDDIDQLTAALAVGASQSLKGGIAGRQLKNVYTNTSKAARELGIENKGMIPTLRAVAAAHWDADKIVSIYGKVALPMVAAQLNKISGTEKGSYSYMLNEMRHASDGMGESAIQAEEMRSSLENQFKILNSQIQDIALSIYDKWLPAMAEGAKAAQKFFTENKDAIVGLVDAFVPLLEIIGVGGALILGLKATALILPTVAFATDVLSLAMGGGALTTAAMNTSLFGTSIAATAATGAMGYLAIAAGVVFSAFVGWKFGSFLFKEFESVRLMSLGLTDTVMSGFIEMEFAGKMAWAVIKDAASLATSVILSGLSSMADAAAATYNALGSFELGGEMTRASIEIRKVSRGLGEVGEEFFKLGRERKAARAEHQETIDQMALEHRGYKTGAEAAREAGEIQLAMIRGKTTATSMFSKKQIKGMEEVSAKEIEAAALRLQAQEKLFKDLGVMGDDLYKKKRDEIDNWVTQMRLGTSDEVLIEKEKNKRIDKLNAQRLGKTVKQVKNRVKAQKKGIDESLKDFFGGLDTQDKLWTKHNNKMLKDRASMQKEMEKLEVGQGKEFEKTLEKSQDIYENFIKDQLGIKELSVESQKEIDKQYQVFFDGVQSGEIESFTVAQTDILTAKELNIEELKKNDVAYKIFLAEQATEHKRIRMDFFKTTGGMSTEYYAKLAGDIDKQSGVLQKAGVDAVEIEKWKTGEFLSLDIKKLESGEGFFTGLELGLKKSAQDFTTWKDVGVGAFQEVEKGIAVGLSGSIKALISGDMATMGQAWDGVWKGMLDTVIDKVSQIAAQWAAQKLTGFAVRGADALLGMFSGAPSAKDGAFDVGQTGPGQQAGGVVPILAHVGESILPKGLTDEVKSGIGFDDFKDRLRGYFGIDSGQADGIWASASEYSGTGGSLLKAWKQFDDGDEVGGIVEAMDAMSNAFKTYAEQNGSQVAANIGKGLGEASGAISAGYGAYTAFEAEDYLAAVTQSLQAVQSAVSVYGTVTGQAVGAGGSLIGATATGALSGAGQGMAAWNILASLGDIRGSQKAEAQVGAAAGGAALGTAIGGPLGSVVGGIYGGIAGSLVGGSREGEFDLSDADPHLAEARLISGGKISMIPEPGPGNWFAVTLGQYFDHLNTQASAVNQLTDSITADMTGDQADFFKMQMDTALNSAVGTIESGGNYNRNRADQMVMGVGNYYWRETIGALESVVGGAVGISDAKRSEMLSLIASTTPESYMNPVDMPSNLARYEEERATIDPWFAAQLKSQEEARLSHMSGGGAATGGIIAKGPEDGTVSVTNREGILNVPEMTWIRDVGRSIQSQPTPAPGRERQLEKAVSLLTEILTVLTRSENIQEAMASRGGGEIDFESLAESIAPALESGTASSRFEFTAPDVRRATDRVNQRSF